MQARVDTAHDLTDVRRMQRSREIFESNSLEGLGPDITRTDQLIQEFRTADVHDGSFQRMLAESVTRDPHLVAVLGLNTAKILSEELLVHYQQRPVSASDLRGLHSQICAGEWHAGQYKQHSNEIEDSDHKTSLPIDTGAAVSGLTDWLASPGELPPTVIAAVAHGWLTHIHPFFDGNGRTARLLMNLLLTGARQPPVIIRHDTDRNRYLDALAESDRGGDLLPLVDIFLDAQERFAKELNSRDALRRIIRQELNQQTQDRYTQWLAVFNEFMAELAAALTVNRLRLDILQPITPLAFEQLLGADPAGNSWCAWIRGQRSALLLWIGFSSSELSGAIDSDTRWPSMRVSVRAPSYSERRLSPSDASRKRRRKRNPGATACLSIFASVWQNPPRTYPGRRRRDSWPPVARG